MQDKLKQLQALNAELEKTATQLQNSIAEHQAQLNQVAVKLVETRAKMRVVEELMSESAPFNS